MRFIPFTYLPHEIKSEFIVLLRTGIRIKSFKRSGVLKCQMKIHQISVPIQHLLQVTTIQQIILPVPSVDVYVNLS